MGNDLFGVDIAGLIATHVAPGLLDVVLTIYTPGERASDNLAGGRAMTPTPYWGTKGFWDDIQPGLVDGTQILVNDRRAVLIGDTLPAGVEIKPNDQITIEEITLFVIRLLRRDPAKATFEYLCRDRRAPANA